MSEISEILTIDDLAAFLKCSRRSIYNLTRKRSQAGVNPCPVLKNARGYQIPPYGHRTMAGGLWRDLSPRRQNGSFDPLRRSQGASDGPRY
jgi:hypothetical protein